MNFVRSGCTPVRLAVVCLHLLLLFRNTGAAEAGEHVFFPRLDRGGQTFSIEAGGHYGLKTLGSLEAHHMALLSTSYGYVLGTACEESPVLRGNFELRGELFAGWQVSPEDDWMVGLTPHLRYNFDTHSRWVPFVDGGAGLTAVTIDRPDLSGNFEFNLQIGVGLHYFLSKSMALTTEARFMHLSCAGLSIPNRGVNGVVGLLGVTWLF